MAARRKGTGNGGKPCRIDADAAVKQEILSCRKEVRQEIGAFLEKLQWDPLPAGRSAKGANSFYMQLPCGIFVVWEVIGNLLHIALHGSSDATLVRILGVGWERQSTR
jgi:hypothetical protein